MGVPMNQATQGGPPPKELPREVRLCWQRGGVSWQALPLLKSHS
jgi:hypothetical protein